MEQTCLIVPREAFYTTQLAVFKLGANGYAVFCWLGFLGIVAASIFPVEKGFGFMVNIQFIEHDGSEHSVEVATGGSVMQAAVTNGVPGIDADCGGSCSCATCHVYVNEQWLGKVGELSPTEEAMLSLSTDRKDNSRLSCQIQVTEELDGLVVTTPEFQF
jgi:2Fe-2S ferredoxin|tara:strand:- start:322 stop:801 length:480 start_codon:yes stop_codon:yes gene_type:complete